MKALLLKDTEQIEWHDIELPALPQDHVRVKISAFTLNHLDLFSFRGMAFAKRVLPLIVGAEAVGTVSEVGSSACQHWVGKRVALFPSLICGVCVRCKAGQENLCEEERKIFGFHVNGVAAEFVNVSENSLIEIPDGVDWHDAACAPITFGTVHHMLFDNAKLKEGESILIHSGGSGIGSTAIKMAKQVGATVYTTVGSDVKAENAKKLGADYVINYRDLNFAREIRKLTNKKGVDVVFEHVGVDTWEGSMASLKVGGRLVTCGSTTGVESKINLFALFNKQLKLFGSFGGSKRNISDSLQLMHSAGIKPTIDSKFSVSDYAMGLNKLKHRDVFGKIVFHF